MGSVNITLANGGLGGTTQTNDGIAGMVLTGGIDGGGYVLGTPVLITSVASLAAAGITTDGNAFAYRQVVDFYKSAGDGAQLYLMLVENTMTVAMMADSEYENSAKKLLDYAGGKIRLIGIMTDDESIDTPVIEDALNSDIPEAAVNLKAMAADYFAAHKPFRGIIGGTSYTSVAGDLADVATGGSNNRTAILIGDTESGVAACLGLMLGVAASIPVMRKISRVRSGALLTNTAFVGTIAVGDVDSNEAVIAGKGYITFATYANTTGFFFSGDPMCVAPSDDYAMLARGRVIDKAHVLAYTTFVQVVDDEVPVNDDGTLDAGFCKNLEQQMKNNINNTMGAGKEISSVRVYIDPAQNILSTNELNVVVSIIPVGYATEINISLGFINPANS